MMVSWCSAPRELAAEGTRMARRPKLKPAEALHALAHLGANEKRAVYLRPKASDTAIRRMQVAAQRDLGEAVPDGYVALLRITNGAQINGAYFKEAENLVSENLDVLRPEIIVLGTDGNMAEHVFDKRDRRFHTINMGHPDERFESFDTFEAMLLAVLIEQQVL
jgi:hypothetical protein